LNLIRNNNNEIVRFDGGSSQLPYEPARWDKVCQKYFKNSNIYPDKMHGDVLWVGMGGAYGPRNQSENVKSTTIIENSDDIIQRFNIPSKKWNIIEACAYNYDFKDKKFDFIILDIWAKVIYSNELNSLTNKYKKYLKKHGQLLTIKTLKIIN
tara:strand:+ start:889 stop:1347 length:459 start_codon:yes stop_codon:yes gene_type:complete